VIQLFIEYDPQPPVDSGHMSKASAETQRRAKEMMDRIMPAEQRRLVPRIAWRRFIDLVHSKGLNHHASCIAAKADEPRAI